MKTYQKIGFVNGETLKAEQLNHMEEGILNCGSAIINVEGPSELVTTIDANSDLPNSLISEINYLQSGSGYPSRANIRPISGWTKAKLTRYGKNLINMSALTAIGSTTVVEFSGNTARVYTTKNGSYAGANINDTLTLKAGISYSISANVIKIVSGTIRVGLRRKTDNVFISGSSIHFAEAGMQKATFSVTEDVEAYLSALVTWSTSQAGDATFSNIQLEIGSTATKYEPYGNDTYTCEFGQTVYGGKVDWATGLLTINRGILTLKGTESWAYDSSVTSADCFRLSIPDAEKVCSVVCSHARGDSPEFKPDYAYINGSGALAWNFSEHGTTTLNQFKAYLGAQSTPAQVCYKLASPRTIYVTSQQIELLDKFNNIYSDCGDTTLTYTVDTKAYIDKKIEALTNAIISLGGNV